MDEARAVGTADQITKNPKQDHRTVPAATRLGAIGILMSTAALPQDDKDGVSQDELLPLAQEEASPSIPSPAEQDR